MADGGKALTLPPKQNMSQRSIGLLLQVGAVIGILSSLFSLAANIGALLNTTPHSSKFNLDVGDYLLPFALWFLGSELKHKSDNARRVTRVAMAYLAAVGTLCLVFLLTTDVLDLLPGIWKIAAYSIALLVIFIPALCVHGLRREN